MRIRAIHDHGEQGKLQKSWALFDHPVVFHKLFWLYIIEQFYSVPAKGFGKVISAGCPGHNMSEACPSHPIIQRGSLMYHNSQSIRQFFHATISVKGKGQPLGIPSHNVSRQEHATQILSLSNAPSSHPAIESSDSERHEWKAWGAREASYKVLSLDLVTSAEPLTGLMVEPAYASSSNQ